MKAAEVKENEGQRLQALLETALLDTEPEVSFDELVELASEICQTPIALVSLVDAERQWFKARKGLTAPETERSISFCGHAIHEQKIFIVEDAQADERFYDNPLVVGDPKLRFYAGAVLKTPDNFAIGTLCVIDHQPRSLSPAQERALEILAHQVTQLIELRKSNLKLREHMQTLVAQTQIISRQQQELIVSAELAALGKMAAGIAHEINNPLAVIQGRAFQLRRSLQSGTLEPAHMIKGFEYIESMCLRIGKIIRGLRAFARDAAQDPQQDELLQRIIEETIDLCGERFRASHIELRVAGDLHLTLSCRRTQISQVLLNLLNNAHDAIEGLEQKWVEIEVRSLPHFVQIRVTDSGSGIPEPVVRHMMEPFFTTKDVGRGTGLGLSIAKGIVESHDGQFRYDGSGPHTCFVVELPFQGPATLSEEPSHPAGNLDTE